MSIIDYIKNKCELLEIKGEEYYIPCPYCGSNGEFSFNVVKKVGQCWRQKHCLPFKCNDITLVATLEGVSNSKAMNILGYKKGEVKVGILDKFRSYLKNKDISIVDEVEDDIEKHNNISLPYNAVTIADESMIPKFLLKRGYSIKTIKKFKLGYCNYGKYHDRIIIPIITNDSMAFQARRMYDKGKKYEKLLRKDKKYNQKYLNAYNSKREYLLYNYNQKYRKQYVIVVESVTSVWRLHEYGYQAVATLGCSSVSEYQIELLAKLPIEYIIFCFDRDAIKKAKAFCRDLRKVMDVKFVALPDDRDPDNFSKEEIEEFIMKKVEKPKFHVLKKRIKSRLVR